MANAANSCMLGAACRYQMLDIVAENDKHREIKNYGDYGDG
jgi:hypothetical protein